MDDRIETVRPAGSGYRGFVLFMLLLVYAFNFIDRQIIGILAIPIKAELALTDTQLGLMIGLPFALMYSTLAIPAAWLADRRGRTWIITIALTLWSGFTVLSGFATGFWHLFAARMGVGIGEAGGVAPAHALIADYYPDAGRGRALAIYSFGIPIGSAAGILLGGWIASTVDWRWAFIAIGAAGLLLAPVFRLTVREPARRRDAGEAAASLRSVLAHLAAKPSFWLLSAGAASASIMGYGLAAWLPSFFSRSYALDLLHASRWYGVLTLVGGLAGLWAGGWIGDRLAARNKSAYPLVPAVAFLIAIPFYALGLTMPSPGAAFACFLAPTALALTWFGPIIAALQQIVPSAMRATASAAFLLMTNLVGLAGGTYFLGAVSDALKQRFGEQSLRYAISGGLAFYVLAAALFWLAARALARELKPG